MKKGIIIGIIIFLIIILALVIIGGMFFKSAIQPKTSITASDFYNIMSQKNYTVQDATNQFASYDYIKKVYLAQDSNAKYQIEFYEVADEATSVTFFENNKSIFENSKGNSSSSGYLNGVNFSTYSVTANNKYKGLSRINNTIIYYDVDSTYKNDVENVLKELGY